LTAQSADHPDNAERAESAAGSGPAGVHETAGHISARPATSADGAVVGEVHAASWEAAYAPRFSPEFAAAGIASRRSRWHARLADGGGLFMLGLIGERPLAMCWALESETRPGLAEIYSFYTHPDGWGSGVSPALMTATLKQLKADGYDRVHLWTLRDTPQSRRFYTKMGFAETSAERTRDFGEGNALPQVEYERAID
jgi:GNAT superfamily N-acetyltransferase